MSSDHRIQQNAGIVVGDSVNASSGTCSRGRPISRELSYSKQCGSLRESTVAEKVQNEQFGRKNSDISDERFEFRRGRRRNAVCEEERLGELRRTRPETGLHSVLCGARSRAVARAEHRYNGVVVLRVSPEAGAPQIQSALRGPSAEEALEAEFPRFPAFDDWKRSTEIGKVPRD